MHGRSCAPRPLQAVHGTSGRGMPVVIAVGQRLHANRHVRLVTIGHATAEGRSAPDCSLPDERVRTMRRGVPPLPGGPFPPAPDSKFCTGVHLGAKPGSQHRHRRRPQIASRRVDPMDVMYRRTWPARSRYGGSGVRPMSDDGSHVVRDGVLHEGQRLGRFILLRDVDGVACAVSAGAVSALRETDGGTLLMISGGKLLEVPRAMRTVLEWLDGRG